MKVFVKNGMRAGGDLNDAPGSGLKTDGAVGGGGALVFHFDARPGDAGEVAS